MSVFNEKFMKNKRRKKLIKFFTNFHALDVPEYGIECQHYAIVFINSLLVYENKYYLQVYLKGCLYRIDDKIIMSYLGDNLFESDEEISLFFDLDIINHLNDYYCHCY